jgi:ABC-type sugar transport system permease subunit
MTPSVQFLGLTIHEPTTMVTDLLITMVGWLLASRLLLDEKHGRYQSRFYWGVGLLFISLGALLGAISHGLAAYLGDTADTLIWKSTVYTVGFSMVFAVGGTLAGAPLAAGVRRFFWLVNLADFLYVIYYYVPAMLLIAALQVWALLGKQSHGAGWLLAGVVVTLLGAVVQQSGFALHTHFNYNDMFHLIQVVGLLLFFRGISRLTGQERAARGGNPA